MIAAKPSKSFLLAEKKWLGKEILCRVPGMDGSSSGPYKGKVVGVSNNQSEV